MCVHARAVVTPMSNSFLILYEPDFAALLFIRT